MKRIQGHSARRGGPAGKARQALVQRHWRGGYRLPRSFWLHTFVPCALLVACVQAGLGWVAAPGTFLQLIWLGLLLAWPLLLALWVWGAVGTWRSALAHRRNKGLAAWDWAARSGLVLLGGLVAATLLLDLGPALPRGALLALGIDLRGGLKSEASADGRVLHWQGPIGVRDAAKARAWLAAAPQARLIEIDITGGQVQEARLLAQAVAARGLATRVTGACEDSCLLLFMAGHPHQLLPQARLGFRRVDSGSIWPAVQAAATRRMAAVYRQAGLPETLIEQALGGTRSGVWWLDAHDIQLANLDRVPDRPLDVELQARPPDLPFDDREALVQHPIWRALELRFPGTVAAAARGLALARQSGAEGDALQLAAQVAVQPLWAALLAQADTPLREKFARIRAEALRAARQQGAAACARVMSGELQARRQLPPAQRLQEGEWLSDALATGGTPLPDRAPVGREVEVLQHALGYDAPAALQALRPWPAQAPLACDRAIQVLEGTVALAVPERRLALSILAGP